MQNKRVSTAGEYLQECYRTVCQQKPAEWFNHSTRKFYCESCAKLINNDNRKDAIRMFGHDLCTLGPVTIKEQDNG